MSEIQDMAEQTDFNSLTYYFTTPGHASLNFMRFKPAMCSYNDIKMVIYQ